MPEKPVDLIRMQKAVRLLVEAAAEANHANSERRYAGAWDPKRLDGRLINETLFLALVEDLGVERAEKILKSAAKNSDESFVLTTHITTWYSRRVFKSGATILTL